MSKLQPHERIFVAGPRGMVGSAIVRLLTQKSFKNIVTRTHSELNLVNQQEVKDFLRNEKIDHVVLAAAKVGGIYANNTYPADFIYQNLMIQSNVIHEAYRAGVQNLLFLGSSCIYPKLTPQPMKEEYLLTGELEPSNEPYAIAKIAGIKMCELYNRQYGTSYFSVMPNNLYGPWDNFHLENSHVIPAIIRKYHLAKLAMEGDLEGIQIDQLIYGDIPLDIKEAIGLSADSSRLTSKCPKVVLWGSGTAYREFLHVDDMAAACVFVMGKENAINSILKTSTTLDSPESSFLNVSLGIDQTIKDTATLIQKIVGYKGETVFDTDKPDGTPKKLLNTKKANALGWRPILSLEEGLRNTNIWCLQNAMC